MLSMRPLPLRSGGGRGVMFCRRLFQHHKCKLLEMVERPSKGREMPKKRHFYGCRKNTYFNELTYKISNDFFFFFVLSSIQIKFGLIINNLQGYGTVVPVSLLVPPSALRSATEIASSSKRYMRSDGRYRGRRAWAKSTRSIGFYSSIEAPLWL